VSTQLPPELQRLSGAERAAILLLGMQQEHMGKLMDLLNEDEIRTISRTMSRLGKVDPTIAEAVFNDFSNQVATGGGMKAYEPVIARVSGSMIDSVDSDQAKTPASATTAPRPRNSPTARSPRAPRRSSTRSRSGFPCTRTSPG